MSCDSYTFQYWKYPSLFFWGDFSSSLPSLEMDEREWEGLLWVEAIITIWNHDLVIMIKYFVYIYMTSKRIELERPGCSGFEDYLKSSKSDQQGLSSSIRLEIMYMWKPVHYHDNQIMISNRNNSLHSEQTLSLI